MTASPISSSMPAFALVSGRKTARIAKQGEQEPAHTNSQNDFQQAFREHIARNSDAQRGQQRPNTQTNSKAPADKTALQAAKTAQSPNRDGGASASAQSVDGIQLSGTADSPLQPQSPDAVVAGQTDVHQQATDAQTAGTGAIAAMSATAQANGDPALALRIATGASVSNDESETAANEQGQSAPAPGVGEMETLAASVAANAQAGEDAKGSRGGDPQHHEEGGSQQQALQINTLHNQSASGTGDISKTEGATATRGADFEAELARFRTEPVRGAQVQITGSDNQRVDIRMIERNGTLSLTVRSADHTLSKTLQEHAPELDARLATEHYRTEMWTPTTAKSAETQDLANGNRQGSGGEGAQGGNNSNGQSRQGSKDNAQPAWLQSFEDQAKTIQQRIEYTWHQ